jgi:FAD:protein FMN transferase
MNRRDFFDAGTLARTAGPVIAPLIDLPPTTPTPNLDESLLRISRPAMATLFELMLPFSCPDATAVASENLDLIDELEAQMTVYRDESEVSRINRLAFEQEIPVEPRLFGLLSESARLTTQTWGAFDITSGPLIKTWGFFRRQGRVPSPTERQEAMNRVGMKHVELNAERSTIRFRRPGMEFNLGSIGKGYALDRCREKLQHLGVGSALVHGGGSSVIALGSQPNENRGWPVGLRHPWETDRRIGIVYLRNQAMGTSAATYQHFEYKSRKLGHLLDPRTGQPAEGIASATAIADSAATADALATAFYILGVDKTRLYCQTHPEVGAILLPDGETQPALFGLAALPGANWFTPDSQGTVR